MILRLWVLRKKAGKRRYKEKATLKYDVALILSLEIKQSDKYVETEKISTDDYILEEIAADYMADLFKSALI